MLDWTCHMSVFGDERNLSACSYDSRSGKIAVGSWTSRVKLFNVEGKEIGVLRGHTERVTDVEWQPVEQGQDPLLATAGADKVVLIWKDDKVVQKISWAKDKTRQDLLASNVSISRCSLFRP